MPQSAAAGWLPGGRLHLHHGPIDLIVEAWGAPGERRAAFAQAEARFVNVLEELTAELPLLRTPAKAGAAGPKGAVARRMWAAVTPFADRFVTPMAAVAGAVADEILAAMLAGRDLERAYVNNGGDAALHLAPGYFLDVAIVAQGDAGRARIGHEDVARGIATSGWRGRSFSLGVADAVTVLARSAAAADAAATLIANAVDLPGHPAIRRRPASETSPDSDLGGLAATVDVGPLDDAETAEALARGLAAAEAMRATGAIVAAALFLNGASRLCGAQPAGERLVDA